jgi:hypothetical protein
VPCLCCLVCFLTCDVLLLVPQVGPLVVRSCFVHPTADQSLRKHNEHNIAAMKKKIGKPDESATRVYRFKPNTVIPKAMPEENNEELHTPPPTRRARQRSRGDHAPTPTTTPSKRSAEAEPDDDDDEVIPPTPPPPQQPRSIHVQRAAARAKASSVSHSTAITSTPSITAPVTPVHVKKVAKMQPRAPIKVRPSTDVVAPSRAKKLKAQHHIADPDHNPEVTMEELLEGYEPEEIIMRVPLPFQNLHWIHPRVGDLHMLHSNMLEAQTRYADSFKPPSTSCACTELYATTKPRYWYRSEWLHDWRHECAPRCGPQCAKPRPAVPPSTLPQELLHDIDSFHEREHREMMRKCDTMSGTCT